MDIVHVLKNVMVRFGAGWVLWLLFILSVASVAVAAERWRHFRRRSGSVRDLARRLEQFLAGKDYNGAAQAMAEADTAASKIAEAGLRMASSGLTAAERAMAGAAAAERSSLESRLVFLGTLGNNAPFVGLFGTVIGVILAFDELGKATAGAAQAAGPSNAVMAAIAEALVATAVGIGVALPAVAFYNYFQRRIAELLSESEVLSSLVLAYLAAGSNSGDRTGGGA